MLTDILGAAPTRSIDEVVGLMHAIDDRLPDADGLKWFNRLYLRVTESVRESVGGTTFADPGFMTELDIAFANLYFAAIAAGETDASRAPAAWRPVLRARAARGVARLQFALAGMNAHINRDLPQGIVEAFRARGGDPVTGHVRRADFEQVNAILERVETEVKADLSVGLIGAVDILAGRLDDVAAMWNVRAARAAAWTNAEVLWALRRTPVLMDTFFDRLDRLTGFAGRGLLTPTARMALSPLP